MVHIVIPARYSSRRVQGKPLVQIAGKSLLSYTVNLAKEVSDSVYVATDSQIVKREAEQLGAKAVLTSPGCPTGLDRVIQVYEKEKWPTSHIIVVLPCDELFVSVEHLKSIISYKSNHFSADVVVPLAPLRSVKEYVDVERVKVLICDSNRVLYMTRSPLPVHISDVGSYIESSALQLIPVQALDGYALEKLKQKPQTVDPLESAEKIEHLRAVSRGLGVFGVVHATEFLSGVDTASDLAFAKGIME